MASQMDIATAPSSAGVRSRLIAGYSLMIAGMVACYLLIRSFGERLAAPAVPILTGAAHAAPKPASAIGHVLLALLIIIILARLLGNAFRLLHQPPVIGEIIAGDSARAVISRPGGAGGIGVHVPDRSRAVFAGHLGSWRGPLHVPGRIRARPGIAETAWSRSGCDFSREHHCPIPARRRPVLVLVSSALFKRGSIHLLLPFKISSGTGTRIGFALGQLHSMPERWRKTLAKVESAQKRRRRDRDTCSCSRNWIGDEWETTYHPL